MKWNEQITDSLLQRATNARAREDGESEVAWTVLATQLQLSRQYRYPDLKTNTCREQVVSLLLSLFFFAIIAGAILLIMKGGL